MPGDADLVLKNARIYTVDESRPWATCLSVIGDKISIVGEERDVAASIGPRTNVIDARGRLVLPGFIDSHLHTSMAYQEAFWAHLGSASSFAEIAEAVREHARKHPTSAIICGSGWKYDAMCGTEGGYPDKEQIDEIPDSRPVLLISYCGWVGLGNTRFVELAQESLAGAPQGFAGMERDEVTGEPTGVFFEPGDLEFGEGRLQDMLRENELEGLRWVFGEFPKHGITGVHDAQSDFRGIEAHRRLQEEGGLKARACIAYGYSKTTDDGDLERLASEVQEQSNEWIRLGTVKLFIDGVLDSHTAAMLEPYTDSPGSRGELKYTPERFKELVGKLDGMGFQCMVHACGDRGVRTALDAFEYAANENPVRERRHRVEHIEMLSAEDVPRFGKIGAVASMQPIHVVPVPDSTAMERAAGPDRMMRCYQWRSLIDAGASMAFSSDWAVADMNPFLGIYAAVNRKWYRSADQKISLEEAIWAYTMGGAFASFEEGLKGSIQPGKLADFILLSDNLFEIDSEEIQRCKVVMTVLGGKVVFEDATFTSRAIHLSE